MEQEGNDAARELWSQMFGRAAVHPGAVVTDSGYDPRENDARVRAGDDDLRSSRWL